MGNKKKIAINMVAQFLSFILSLGINFFLAPFITKSVGKEVYGFVNLAFQMTGYISIFTTALNAMLGRYITVSIGKKDYESARSYFSSAMIANAILTAVCFVPVTVGILYLNNWLDVPAQNLLDVQLLWAFIFFDFFARLIANGYAVSTYAVNRLDLSSRRAMESSILRAAVLVAMFVFMPARVWYVGFTKVITGAYVIITNIYFTKKLTPNLYYEKSLVRMASIKKLVKTGIWNTVQQITGILVNGCDTLITNIYINAASMTLMTFAKTIPNYVMSIIGIVCSSFSPQMTLLYAEGDMDKFVKYVKSAIKVCGFICSIPILGFIAFGTKFFALWLPVLSGGEIRTIQILSVMILAQTVFDVYIYPLYTVSQITTKLKIPVLVSLGIGVCNIIGSILLCVNTDLGVYAIQIVSSVLLTARVFFFAPIYAAHILEQKWWTFYLPLLRGALSSAVVLTVFGCISYFVTVNSWVMLGVVAVICGAIGYAINYIIVLNKEERIMVKDMVIKRIKKKNKKES
ncbi:lipopolysaccharide biosynthesis protein [Butyrivibrio sp. FC2001]|uniref:lipopolysaccharide biosynthesis protein n=1 Tax=Butyrivibrio sp. FC2001 TaxID=1280671 RepID=UPI0004152B39|nr:MATE family efflux transporter [Butyrivibrio sp. FC2001]